MAQCLKGLVAHAGDPGLVPSAHHFLDAQFQGIHPMLSSNLQGHQTQM